MSEIISQWSPIIVAFIGSITTLGVLYLSNRKAQKTELREHRIGLYRKLLNTIREINNVHNESEETELELFRDFNSLVDEAIIISDGATIELLVCLFDEMFRCFDINRQEKVANKSIEKITHGRRDEVDFCYNCCPLNEQKDTVTDQQAIDILNMFLSINEKERQTIFKRIEKHRIELVNQMRKDLNVEHRIKDNCLGDWYY